MKKSKQKIRNEVLEIKRIKWECIRRNKDYQKEYKQYKKEKKALIGKIGKIPESWKLEKQVSFLEKWGINEAIDYKKSSRTIKHLPIFFGAVAELCIQKKDYQDDYENPFLNPLIPEYAREGFDLSSENKCRGEGYLADGKYKSFDWHIGIKIDLNYSKERIMNEVGHILDRAIEARKEEVKKGNARKRFDKYRKYLEVYDLRVKKKLKFKEIAEKMFSKEYRNECKKVISTGKKDKDESRKFNKFLKQGYDIDTAYEKVYGQEQKKDSNKVIQRVIDMFQAANKLINKKAYKEIR